MPEFNPSSMELMFWEGLALIVAACFFVPLLRRLGLGTILGYLAAGLAVQATLTLSFSDHPEDLLHFAEFGVVLFLFVIGLELKPSSLWRMRGDIFGLGLAQVAVCGAVLGLVAAGLGVAWDAAVVIGLGLALSSTALVMRTLDERKERSAPHGRKAFAILLFQDLAIVPLLLLVSILSAGAAEMTLTDSLTQLGLAVAAIGILVLVARHALDPLFRVLARTQMPEIMTAAALGVVIAAALLMDVVGLSYATGAFIAGVMLAESSYRHEVEANIEPFRGLFLGLFFMAVGLSLDLGAVADNWLVILAAAPAAMALKGLAIYAVMRLFRSDHDTSARASFALPQSGEFGFVLFAAAGAGGILAGELEAVLVALVTVSMALSPVIMRLEPLVLSRRVADVIDEDYTDAGGRTLLIGFGRFGQIVAQPLFALGADVTILDVDANRVREAGRFGFRVHFGDGSRRDVLRAAGAAEADAIIVCVHEADVANHIVALVRSEFPQAKLLVRSVDRRHSIHLMCSQTDFVVRETFESALRMGRQALMLMGQSEQAADTIVDDVRQRDRDRLEQQAEGDMAAGRDRLYGIDVVPEPLERRTPATAEETP